MRDRDHLRATLRAIQAAGGQAHIVRDRRRGFGCRAGTLVLPGPALDGQAVRDLIADGWLKEDSPAGIAVVEELPNWAA